MLFTNNCTVSNYNFLNIHFNNYFLSKKKRTILSKTGFGQHTSLRTRSPWIINIQCPRLETEPFTEGTLTGSVVWSLVQLDSLEQGERYSNVKY